MKRLLQLYIKLRRPAADAGMKGMPRHTTTAFQRDLGDDPATASTEDAILETLRRREVLFWRRWSLCRGRYWSCERADVSQREINAQYRCNGVEGILCCSGRPGSSMLLTAQLRGQLFRHVCVRYDAENTTYPNQKDTGTGRKSSSPGWALGYSEINGRPRSAVSAHVHLAHRVFGSNQLTSTARSCYCKHSSRLVSPTNVRFGRCMPATCGKKLFRWNGSTRLLVTCAVWFSLQMVGSWNRNLSRWCARHPILVECSMPSSPGCLRIRGFGLFCSLLKWKSGTDGARGRCAQEAVELTGLASPVGVHQTACPSDSFSFCASLCDLGRCLDRVTKAPGMRNMLVSHVL